MPQQDSRRSRAPHLFPGRVTASRRDADAGSRTSSRKSLSLPRLRFVSRAAREGPRTATAPYVSTASGSGPEHAHATDRQEGSPRLWDWSVRDPAPIIHQSLECCIPCRPHGRRSRREECSGEAPVSCRARGETRSSRKIRCCVDKVRSERTTRAPRGDRAPSTSDSEVQPGGWSGGALIALGGQCRDGTVASGRSAWTRSRSNPRRRLCGDAAHGAMSFVFNAALLAVAVNLAASAI